MKKLIMKVVNFLFREKCAYCGRYGTSCTMIPYAFHSVHKTCTYDEATGHFL